MYNEDGKTIRLGVVVMRGEMSDGWTEMTELLNEQQRIAKEWLELCTHQDEAIKTLEAKVLRLTNALENVRINLDYMYVNWGDVPSHLRRRCESAVLDIRNTLKEN
jgi:hypothetical protein